MPGFQESSATHKIRSWVYANEGVQFSLSRIRRELSHLGLSSSAFNSCLSKIRKQTPALYRVGIAEYIFDPRKQHKEVTTHYDTVLELAAANGGKVKLDDVIESCLVTQTTAYSIIDQLKRGTNHAPKCRVKRVTYYEIEEETVDG